MRQHSCPTTRSNFPAARTSQSVRLNTGVHDLPVMRTLHSRLHTLYVYVRFPAVQRVTHARLQGEGE